MPHASNVRGTFDKRHHASCLSVRFFHRQRRHQARHIVCLYPLQTECRAKKSHSHAGAKRVCHRVLWRKRIHWRDIQPRRVARKRRLQLQTASSNNNDTPSAKRHDDPCQVSNTRHLQRDDHRWQHHITIQLEE